MNNSYKKTIITLKLFIESFKNTGNIKLIKLAQ